VALSSATLPTGNGATHSGSSIARIAAAAAAAAAARTQLIDKQSSINQVSLYDSVCRYTRCSTNSRKKKQIVQRECPSAQLNLCPEPSLESTLLCNCATAGTAAIVDALLCICTCAAALTHSLFLARFTSHVISYVAVLLVASCTIG
jgi:hypothetical protein